MAGDRAVSRLVRIAGGPAPAAAALRTVVCAALAALVAAARFAAADGAPQAASRPVEGPAYRLIDLPSGRVRAEARPDVLATPVAPGSLMKLATLVALYEQGLGEVRMSCTRRAVVDGKPLTCVHPDLHRPLTAAEAIGYSCNTYFGVLAQRLRRQSLDAVLIRLGLGPTAPESPVASAAIGLSGVRATPIQLLEAFLRLTGRSTNRAAMPEAARLALREGTELAARAGTARAIGDAGFSGLAKTGTGPMPGGGTMGLVVAVVGEERSAQAIVVIAPGAAGADAAVIAADLLERHGAPKRSAMVRVGIAQRGGGYDIRPMAPEEYVSRVVAGEMGGSAGPAALEAMAITAQTFLEANRGRHEGEGYNLCDLTHCQVLGSAGASTDRAARATEGLVLVEGGTLARVYYSASCGGHTEKPSNVWPGAQDAFYLPARPDPACAAAPMWRTEIAAPDLWRVLRGAGLRGDMPVRFTVASRDASGRAARLDVEGMVPDHLDAGAFRTAAGRLLGWQTVKSTLFEISRTATGYVLTGRGAGHGVGLCVLGAVNRARGGAGRDDILAAYFPGLRAAEMRSASRGAAAAVARAARVRVTLPEAEREHLGEVRTLAADSVRDLAAWLGRPEPQAFEIRVPPDGRSLHARDGAALVDGRREPGYAHRRAATARARLARHSAADPAPRNHSCARRSRARRPSPVGQGRARRLPARGDAAICEPAERRHSHRDGTVPI